MRDKAHEMFLGLLVLHCAGVSVDDLIEHLETYTRITNEQSGRMRQAIRHWQNLQPNFAERWVERME